MIKLVGTTRIPTFSGTKLRAAREDRGWSRGRLGIALGKTTTSVAAWERGLRNPAPDTLKDIAEALEITTADLLTLSQDEWGLAEYRVTHGWEQKDVAERIAIISPSLLSQIESTYERPKPAQITALAKLYGIGEPEVMEAWQRARDRVLRAAD